MWVLLAGISISVFTVNLFYVYWIYRGMRKINKSPQPQNSTNQKLSIIIAAHNEGNNIDNCLRKLVDQKYPKDKYEIIVVADRCTDSTARVAAQFSNKFSKLKLIEIKEVPPGISPKKYALDRGIKEASYDPLLFLDADVFPTRDHLQTINLYFSNETDVVVGVMKLFSGNTLRSRFLMYERLLNWSVAAGSIGNNNPIISYGGNWAYTRQAFNKVEGFEGIFHSLGGDDDLLLQKFGKANLRIQFCSNPKGWVTTEPPKSFKKLLQQRRRHFSAGKYYQKKFQIGYFFYHISNLLLWVMPLFYLPAIFLLVFKIFLNAILIRFANELFKERINLVTVPIFEFLLMLYNALIGPLGFIGRVKW